MKFFIELIQRDCLKSLFKKKLMNLGANFICFNDIEGIRRIVIYRFIQKMEIPGFR